MHGNCTIAPPPTRVCGMSDADRARPPALWYHRLLAGRLLPRTQMTRMTDDTAWPSLCQNLRMLSFWLQLCVRFTTTHTAINYTILCYVVLHCAFSALTLLVGQQEGHSACKKWVVGCWRGCLSGARCRLAYGPADATPLTVSCSSKIQIGFTFLVPAYPGCPGKEAVKWLL